MNILNGNISKNITLMLLLMLLPLKDAIAQNLSQKDLSNIESKLQKLLNEFIKNGYNCFTDKSLFHNAGNVVDAEGYLTDIEDEQIEQMIDSLQAHQQVKIEFIIKNNTTASGTINDFSTSLFECLGVGMKQADNGLLITLDLQGHKSHMTTGYGAEGVIPDIEASRICRLGREYFKNNDIVGGFAAIKEGIEKYLSEDDQQYLNERINDATENSRSGKELILNILTLLLIAGFGGGSIYLISKDKKRFTERIEQYNSLLSKLGNSQKSGQQEYKIITDLVENVEKSGYQSYERAKGEIDKLLATVQEVIQSTEGVFDADKSSEVYQGSGWQDYFGTAFVKSKVTIEKINTLTEVVGNMETKLGILSTHGNNLSNILESFKFMTKELTGYLERISSSITGDSEYILELEKEGYSFQKIKEQIAELTSLLESYESKILDDRTILSEKQKNKELIDQTNGRRESSINGLKALYAKYTTNTSSLQEVTIPENIITEYTTTLGKLSALTETLVDTYQKKQKEIEDIIYLQNESIPLFTNSHQKKELEVSDSYYQIVASQYRSAQELVNELKEYLQNMKGAKENIPGLIKTCQTSLSNALSGLHSQYTVDLKTQEDKLKNLVTRAKSNKEDWINIKKDIEDVNKEITSIKKKSDAKKEQEYQAEQARIKAEEDRQRQQDADDAEERRNNSIGGGRTGGGGGGDSR